ncbi:Hypothetical protein PHPALM_13828 [Phytophthora palmivora]|uniref:Uncharacterized protein n=1 Tax=Phytophthora palmivora TaxID=4796 RepID=A0A2P4XWB8_9STRA|nr:Hypothetical protein PHPALM_13828 [Phytophthora palmivora]
MARLSTQLQELVNVVSMENITFALILSKPRSLRAQLALWFSLPLNVHCRGLQVVVIGTFVAPAFRGVMSVGRVLSFFSGHYQNYGLNGQTCADHLRDLQHFPYILLEE